MTWKIPLSDITMGCEEDDAVRDVLRSRWLSMGPVTEEFEAAFARYLGVKHAFAVSNGTAALHIAHAVLGIGSGDEVVTPSLTFVATANSVLYCGAKPVFADITGPGALNVSWEDIAAKVTEKTRAITVVHYGGYACDMRPIMEIARDHDLRVVEDTAHAVGAAYGGRKCGAIGDVGCFSFFANKNLSTGEGGMIVTDDDRLAEKIRVMRSHGMTTLTWDRHRGHSSSYDVTDLGYNYRTSEVASALGIVQLRRLEENNERRRDIVKRYRRTLAGIEQIECPFGGRENGKSSHHIFPVILSADLSRAGFQAALKERGIQTSIHYPPVHLFTYYRRLLGDTRGSLPKTEFVGEHEVTLPLYPGMSDGDVAYVCTAVEEAAYG
ncbi:MAG: DegT/DnrJ/EryC1/StrS aminotransferase [Methanomicrobiales archaeon HGW-Methanomicrobiales-6]|jgi:dTDP-4-amino-4,6-dideoxygalactose transaminase|nr:DegT/DnrJ/EryC1/StrS family aminotransferase [Methanoculleus sp.]PKL57371.1 MAG: DegT/DnrJ/EryC1/StrS aminotransferase [Methanomicrobiales archaeon HGW-Methanomicrobiales-6]